MLIPHAWLAAAVGALVSVGAAGVVGYRMGTTAGRAQAQEQVQEMADRITAARDAADAQAESRRLASRAADAEFARWRRDQEARRVRASTDLRNALQAPATCPAGTLAAVPIPAAVVRSLLNAGADHAAEPPGPAASSPRRGVLARP